MEDTEITVRHNKKLEQIRAKDSSHVIVGSNNSSTEEHRRSPEASGGNILTAQRPDERDTFVSGDRAQGAQNASGTDRGYDQGIRSADAASITPAQNVDRVDGQAGELRASLTEEEKAERERELARMRKQRQRDRDKEQESDDLSSIRDRDRDSVTIKNVTPPSEESRFRLIRNPFKKIDEPPQEKVKLFSKKEAEEEKKHLSYIYYKGSGLIDEILQIIVKGHQEISIWQLDEGEADILAEIHLERAQKDQEAAYSARALLSLYDQIFIIMLMGPRAKQTAHYIIESGGLSFK